VFRKWFELRFYPLIQDLVGEELTATEMDQEFMGSCARRWRGWSSGPEGGGTQGRRPATGAMLLSQRLLVALVLVKATAPAVVAGPGNLATVRLACIDAPEMTQAPYGAQARSYLHSRLQVGTTVTLQPKTVDRYGRTVAEVIGEINLGLAMVEDGQAFAYRKYLGQCDAREYLDAEFRASRHRYGVWQVPGGIIRPWDLRRGRSSARSGGDTGSVRGGRR
jgi:endonuclease YncB( thermonuclease family)